MVGKTCLITGATNGIGRVAAVELARMGAELFLVYRNKARADHPDRDTYSNWRSTTCTIIIS
jgi:short-subunit dehydrogenase